MDLKLNLDANVHEVISASVFAALGNDGREMIMKQAVAYLLSQQSGDGYGRRRESPLMDAVHSALRLTAENMVRTMLETDEIMKAKIHGMVVEALDKATGERREEIVTKMASALGDAFHDR